MVIRVFLWLMLFNCCHVWGAELQVELPAGRSGRDAHFAMTNWFYNYEWKEPEKQIRLLQERGYRGVMLSLQGQPRTAGKCYPGI